MVKDRCYLCIPLVWDEAAPKPSVCLLLDQIKCLMAETQSEIGSGVLSTLNARSDTSGVAVLQVHFNRDPQLIGHWGWLPFFWRGEEVSMVDAIWAIRRAVRDLREPTGLFEKKEA